MQRACVGAVSREGPRTAGLRRDAHHDWTIWVPNAYCSARRTGSRWEGWQGELPLCQAQLHLGFTVVIVVRGGVYMMPTSQMRMLELRMLNDVAEDQ